MDSGTCAEAVAVETRFGVAVATDPSGLAALLY